MGAPIHSQDGKVQFNAIELADVLSWSLSNNSDNPSYVSSESGGETLRVEGNKDWSATVSLLLNDGDDLALQVGDSALLELFTSDVAAKGGKWSGTGRVSSVEPETDINGNAIVGATVNFESNGAITFTANV